MKLYFDHADALAEGIVSLAPLLGITPVFSAGEASDAAVTVRVIGTEDDMLSLSRTDSEAVITYGPVSGVMGGRSRFFRALGYLCDALRRGERAPDVTERPLFRTNGVMVDMSRNAVMRPEIVKDMLRRLALMGLNTFMLYTEDTYEIPSRPYFGHMRGRYTRDELHEIDREARALGIELVPCIQLLGHLSTMLNWSCTGPYRDTASTLRVGAEETYRLIGEMLDSVADGFSSRRLHMGMDETHDLGRGLYYDRSGYTPPRELYLSHLTRVSEMALSRGFRPMMWSDMFFRMAGEGLPDYNDYDERVTLTEEIAGCLPAGVQPVFWDYYHAGRRFYDVNLEKHLRLSPDTLFAGGVWTWSGYAAQPERSRMNSLPALNACREAGVKEVFVTVWHNGAESFPYVGLCGAALYAEYDYRRDGTPEGVSACLSRTCGLPYSVFTDMSEVDYAHGYGSARALLYNDPLQGLCDRHAADMDTEAYYAALSARLSDPAYENGLVPPDFLPAFRVIRALARVLELKADLGVCLKRAYDHARGTGDRTALGALLPRCDEAAARVGELRRAHRAAWTYYNKPFGWEVFDIRYGGLLARLDTTRETLTACLRGETDRIDELDAPRLRFDCGPENVPAPMGDSFCWKRYTSVATANIL